MLKRIILVSVSLGVILVGFALYRQFSGDMPEYDDQQEKVTVSPRVPLSELTEGSIQIADPDWGKASIGQTRGIRYVDLDDNGRIKREFGFTKRLSGTEGLLVFTHPWVKSYTGKDRFVHITAARARVPLDEASEAGTIPQTGELEGNVLIELCRLPEECGGDPIETSPESGQVPTGSQGLQAGFVEMTVELESVYFELEFSRISTTGVVNITSDEFAVRGSDLTFQYDQVHDRLQELELLHVEKLRLSTQAGNTMSRDSGATADSTGSSGIDESVDPKEQPNNKPTRYKLTLRDNVVIDQGGEQITANRVEILADIDSKTLTTQNKTEAESKYEHKSVDNHNGTKGQGNNAIDEQGKAVEMVSISCKGPLRIRTVSEESVTASEAEVLQFRAFGDPVRLWRNGSIAGESKCMVYDDAAKTFTLLAAEHKAVRLALGPDQWATAKREVSVNMETGLATLAGPGHVDYIIEGRNSQQVAFDYTDRMHLKFMMDSEVGTSQFKILPSRIQWLSFIGPLQAKSADTTLNAQNGRLEFYTAKDSCSQQREKSDSAEDIPPIKQIELGGGVHAVGEDGRLSCREIVWDFQMDSCSKAIPKQIVAKGDVEIEDPNRLIEASEQLTLTFLGEQQQKNGKKEEKEDKRSSWDIAKMFKSPNKTLLEGADRGVKYVDKDRGIEVIGNRIEGSFVDEKWVVYGNPAQVIGLRQAGQLRNLEASVIELDLGNELCQVAGVGAMTGIVDRELLELGTGDPIDLHIHWLEDAHYDMKNQEILLGDVVADAIVSDKYKRRVELQCQTMTIVLDDNEGLEKENKTKARDKSDSKDILTRSALKKFIAHGPNVSFASKEYNLDGDELTRSMTMEASGVVFDNENQMLIGNGAGWIEIIDNRHAKDDPCKNVKDSNSLFTAATISGGPSYSLLAFGERMQYEVAKGNGDGEFDTLCFDGNVRLCRLPMEKMTLDEVTRRIVLGPVNAKIEGMLWLDCDELSVSMPRQSRDDQQDRGVRQGRGAFGLDDLDEAQAQGKVYFVYFADDRAHVVTAESMAYERSSGLVRFGGQVYLDDMPFADVQFNIDTGEFVATPLAPGAIPGLQ